MRHRLRPELLRARYRVLLFLILMLCSLAPGGAPLALSALGLGAALLSLRIAIAQGPSLSITFVTLDWLLVSLLLVTSGGVGSAYLAVVPFLSLIELAPAPPEQRLSMLAPSGAFFVVLLIADPHLGGQTPLRLLELGALLGAGLLASLLPLAARRLAQGKAGCPQRPPSVDPSTGFSTLPRLAELLGGALREAAAEHEALSVACVRLDHFADACSFLGHERTEAMVCGVARRLRRRLRRDDLAFRVSPDTFVLGLRGRLPREARNDAAAMAHDVAAELVEGRRQTIAVGVASYPAARTLEELLRAAHLDLEKGESRAAAAQ